MGIQIARSVRFRSGNSAYISRTFAGAGNRLLWTFRVLVKASAPIDTTRRTFLSGPSNGGTGFYFGGTSETQGLSNYQAGTVVNSTAVLRDPAGWNELVIRWDTAQATASNRILAWWNNVPITLSGYPAQNTSSDINNVGVNYIGSFAALAGYYFEGYMADVYFCDGFGYSPSDFSSVDPVAGTWTPKAFSGSYGTNGYHLDFSDNSSLTNLCLDRSGNGNNFTATGLSVTAGATNDSLTDTPTNYGTDTGLGGEVRGNFATWNPLCTNGGTYSESNLRCTVSYNTAVVPSTLSIPAKKVYAEFTSNSAGNGQAIGVSISTVTYPGISGVGVGAYSNGGFSGSAGGSVGPGGSSTPSYTSGDVIGIAYDGATGKVWFRKNGTFVGASAADVAAGLNWNYQFTSPASVDLFFAYADGNNTANAGPSANFGQRVFANAAPTGFVCLCTQNFDDPAIKNPKQYFDVNLRTGTGAAFAVSGMKLQPDIVMSKSRSATTDFALYDSVRGVQNDLAPNTTGAETVQAQGVTAFNSDGYSGGTLTKLNASAATFVDWLWKRSVLSGVDVVTYNGNGSNQTIAHNLGVAPKFIIIKRRGAVSGYANWIVYHAAMAATNGMFLNTTGAQSADSTLFNNTAPTTSVFSVGSNASSSGETYVAYVFAEVPNFSKFTTFTGNAAASGPHIYMPFRPRWLLIKSLTTNYWEIFDTARDVFNTAQNRLFFDMTVGSESAFATLDIVSNGVKIRTTDSGSNTSAQAYAISAFADVPIKYTAAPFSVVAGGFNRRIKLPYLRRKIIKPDRQKLFA